MSNRPTASPELQKNMFINRIENESLPIHLWL